MPSDPLVPLVHERFGTGRPLVVRLAGARRNVQPTIEDVVPVVEVGEQHALTGDRHRQQNRVIPIDAELIDEVATPRACPEPENGSAAPVGDI